MRKVINYVISKECIEDMMKAGRFNQCLEIIFRDRSGKHKHKISAGYGDQIYVYREQGETFVLLQNRGHGYIGLETFKGDEALGEIFLEDHQVKEVLGKHGLVPFTIIRRLRRYVNP